MMVAPPLLLLGAPLIPLVRGLPILAAREFAGPFLNWPLAQRVGRVLVHPVFTLLLMGAMMLGWHVPGPYELALSSSSWHQFEHACFLFASLLFWWPVVQPWPSVARWPRWSMMPYLLIGDLQNTILSAILVFSDRVLYPTYATVPRLFGFSALQDQAAAGATMWVVGSIAFLIPAIITAIQCLSRKPLPATIAPSFRREGTELEDDAAIRSSFLKRLLPAGTSDRAAQAIAFVTLFVLTALCLAWLASSNAADDDDQVVRSVQQSSTLAVSLLAPHELVAGTNNFAILVQDRTSQDVILNAWVELAAYSAAAQVPVKAQANSGDSQNKLLQSAELNLPSAGNWTLKITVQRGSEQTDFSVPLQVGESEATSEIPWTKVLLIFFATLLLLVYLRRHRQAKSGELKHSISSV
jgi:preprotein translocase subunit SecG